MILSDMALALLAEAEGRGNPRGWHMARRQWIFNALRELAPLLRKQGAADEARRLAERVGYSCRATREVLERAEELDREIAEMKGGGE